MFLGSVTTQIAMLKNMKPRDSIEIPDFGEIPDASSLRLERLKGKVFPKETV